MTRGSKPKDMGANCSSAGGALLLAPGLLAAGTGVAGEVVGVEVAVAAGEAGASGAVGEVLSEVPGPDAAVGVKAGTAGAWGPRDASEGEAVDGTTGATGTGLNGAAGEAAEAVGLDGSAGGAVSAVGLAAVESTGVDAVPGVGERVATGTAVVDGKGSDSGDGVGICTEVDAGVVAGVTGEVVGCGEDGEKRGVEGDAYGEATCTS